MIPMWVVVALLSAYLIVRVLQRLFFRWPLTRAWSWHLAVAGLLVVFGLAWSDAFWGIYYELMLGAT